MIFLSLATILKNEEKGSVVVLVAVALVVILAVTALVVDVGTLTLEKERLSNACDAAALAAARELPSMTAAEQKALEYLEFNHVSPTEATVSINPSGTQITVAASRTINYVFAPVLGLYSGTVNAQAVATFGVVDGITGIVPFGIPDQTLFFGQECQLKAGSHDDYGPGNYGALALALTGAQSYCNYLKYGYNGMIKVGDWLQTEPGNMSGPTADGVHYRLHHCFHTPRCTPDHYHPDCPMIMIVPVYAPASLYGRDEVQVLGFASFLLKGVQGTGEDSIVTGYFLKLIPPDGLAFTINPSQTDYGLHAARLLE